MGLPAGSAAPHAKGPVTAKSTVPHCSGDCKMSCVEIATGVEPIGWKPRRAGVAVAPRYSGVPRAQFLEPTQWTV